MGTPLGGFASQVPFFSLAFLKDVVDYIISFVIG
jgi:hypothetical protein